MLALYSNFTSWCSQYLLSLISNCLASFASITDCGRVFHKSTILLVKENFLKFILHNFFLIFLLWPLVRVLGSKKSGQKNQDKKSQTKSLDKKSRQKVRTKSQDKKSQTKSQDKKSQMTFFDKWDKMSQFVI
jgi:hypothetical protein